MIRLAVRVARADAEVALAALLDLAPDGVEEVDVGPDVVEYAVYGAAGELPALPDLRAAAGEALVDVSTTELAEDWGERWKQFHRPVLIGDPGTGPALYVRPPWAPPWEGEGAAVHDLAIEPGQAFGTGAHPTTRLCLELLVERARQGQACGALCDVGCGSGVIAIGAARLGWGPVLACDHDPLALRAAAENVGANGADVRVTRVDVREQAPPCAPTMVANLLGPLLCELVLTLARSAAPPPELVIFGGLLGGEVDEVAGALAAALGLHEIDHRAQREWAAFAAGRRMCDWSRPPRAHSLTGS